MIGCLETELDARKEYLENELVETIYFGGGTPSLLSIEQITGLLDRIYKLHEVADSPEITLEANPDDLSQDKLNDLFAAGINRLSIGIQTFDPELLSFLNRAHNRDQALACVPGAREAGFENISVDLIYAIPDEPAARLTSDLELISALDIRHVSTYCLTIEPGTAFGNWEKKGKINPVDEEKAASDYISIMNHLRDRGFDHYEISNFARSGWQSRHNTSYWQGKKYLGIGPGAHSYDQVNRHFNIRNNAVYMKQMESGDFSPETDLLTETDHINEFILTGLRTRQGIDMARLMDLYGIDLHERYGDYLENLRINGLVRINDGLLQLTDRGKLLADQIAEDLFQLPAD